MSSVWKVKANEIPALAVSHTVPELQPDKPRFVREEEEEDENATVNRACLRGKEKERERERKEARVSEKDGRAGSGEKKRTRNSLGGLYMGEGVCFDRASVSAATTTRRKNSE